MKKFNPQIADHARELTGKFFRERRIELGMKAKELSECSGLTQSQISNFENGKQNITINSFFALCGCLRIKNYFEAVSEPENDVPGFGKIDLN